MIMLSLTLLGGGIARLALAFQPSMIKPFTEKSFSRTQLLIIAFVNIVVAITGMVFLLQETFGPFQILIGVGLITTLVEIVIRLKSGGSLWPKSR